MHGSELGLCRRCNVSCAEGSFYYIYTDCLLLNMSGSKDMAVPNQVTYLTLSNVIHVSVMPNRDVFLERNGSPTSLKKVSASVNGY